MKDIQDRGALPPIVSVVGRSKVGKTTFLVKLIAELTKRGYDIAVIKHTIHAFDFSQPGKDTHKHTKAGAKAVALASARELVLTRPLDTELEIDQIAAMLGSADLVLTEGYKHAHKPKIEVSRRELGTELVSRSTEIIAVVSDHPVDLDVPQYELDNASGVADLIERLYLSAPA